jgi:hypothetical protein
VPLVVFPAASLVALRGTAVGSEAWKECLETKRKTKRKTKVVGGEMEAGGKEDEG